jgi:hypothetical protein
MSQQVRAVGGFGGWIERFEQNSPVHTRADAAIDFDLLEAIGYRRTRFVRDVLADFAKVAIAVLR